MRGYYTILLVLICILLLACNNFSKDNSEELHNDVDDFAIAYFNYDFKNAEKYCTPESKRWLSFAASNIHQADVNVLRNTEQGASVEINDFEYNDDDSTGFALITVNNYMCLDTIGKAGHIINKAKFKLPIILHNGKWTVRMEGLPRNERLNHD